MSCSARPPLRSRGGASPGTRPASRPQRWPRGGAHAARPHCCVELADDLGAERGKRWARRRAAASLDELTPATRQLILGLGDASLSHDEL